MLLADGANYLENFDIHLGPFVRRPMSTNPGLNFNPGFFFFCLKAFSKNFFCYIFIEHPITKLQTKGIY